MNIKEVYIKMIKLLCIMPNNNKRTIIANEVLTMYNAYLKKNICLYYYDKEHYIK